VKPSSNEATEMPTRTYRTLEKTHILERENSYLENNQVSKVEWWRRFRAAARKTHELQAQYLEISLTILNENCWNTDKNMCNIGKMTCFKKETRTFISERSYSNLILQCNHLQRKLLMYGQKHTRHWQNNKFQKEKICTLEITMFPE